MQTAKLKAALGCCLVFVALLSAQTKPLSASEAKQHVGQEATVCGKVASARYAARSRGRPTFLNLDKPYPNEIFTIVIWSSDRPKFGQPETRYLDEQVCVTGRIASYRGTPEIVAHEPGQIVVKRSEHTQR